MYDISSADVHMTHYIYMHQDQDDICTILYAILDIIQEAASSSSNCMYSLDLVKQGPFCAVYGIVHLLPIQILLLATTCQTSRGGGGCQGLPYSFSGQG